MINHKNFEEFVRFRTKDGSEQIMVRLSETDRFVYAMPEVNFNKEFNDESVAYVTPYPLAVLMYPKEFFYNHYKKANYLKCMHFEHIPKIKDEDVFCGGCGEFLRKKGKGK